MILFDSPMLREILGDAPGGRSGDNRPANDARSNALAREADRLIAALEATTDPAKREKLAGQVEAIRLELETLWRGRHGR